MKPARHGTRIPWHQDLSFFVHDRAKLLACMIYFDDSTRQNGCLRTVPGSHKRGHMNHFKDRVFTGAIQEASVFDPPSAHIAASVRAGGMIIFHCLTVHSSPPNLTEMPRRGMIFEYKYPEARLSSGAFNFRIEVPPVGMMVRGCDPRGELLA